MWEGHFEMFFKMVLRCSHLALEAMFSGRDTLLARVTGFLIATAIVGRYDDAVRAPLLPLLAALGAFHSTLGGGHRWGCPAATGGRFHATLDEGNPNHLLARGLSSGNVEQLFGSCRLFMAELVYQGNVMPSQNADMTSASATLGGSWYFCEKRRM
jgi:hypothetical protein